MSFQCSENVFILFYFWIVNCVILCIQQIYEIRARSWRQRGCTNFSFWQMKSTHLHLFILTVWTEKIKNNYHTCNIFGKAKKQVKDRQKVKYPWYVFILLLCPSCQLEIVLVCDCVCQWIYVCTQILCMYADAPLYISSI